MWDEDNWNSDKNFLKRIPNIQYNTDSSKIRMGREGGAF